MGYEWFMVLLFVRESEIVGLWAWQAGGSGGEQESAGSPHVQVTV